MTLVTRGRERLATSDLSAAPDDPHLGPKIGPWVGGALRLLVIYAAVRVELLLADVLVAHMSYGGKLSGPLAQWDGQHYLNIAAHGYPTTVPMTFANPAGFEPGFPVLIRIVETVGLSYTVAALVVSLVGGAAATLLVWRLGAAVRNEQTGFEAAVLFITFPGMAVVWGLLYSESVGLALAAASLLLIVKERWVWAGLVGALATATSPLALPLALAAAVPAARAIRRREAPAALVTVALVPLGFLGFAAWLGLRYHDALYWWHVQSRVWGAHVDFGRSLVLLLGHFWSGGYQGKGWLEWAGLVVVVTVAILVFRARLPAGVVAYCIGVIVLLFVINQLGFKPRLLTWAFPALLAVAAVARGRWFLVIVIASATLLPIVFIAYTGLGNTLIQP